MKRVEFLVPESSHVAWLAAAGHEPLSAWMRRMLDSVAPLSRVVSEHGVRIVPHAEVKGAGEGGLTERVSAGAAARDTDRAGTSGVLGNAKPRSVSPSVPAIPGVVLGSQIVFKGPDPKGK